MGCTDKSGFYAIKKSSILNGVSLLLENNDRCVINAFFCVA